MRRKPKTETDFHRHQTVTYIDPKLRRATVQQGLRHYAASALIYGVVLVFFRVCPWFRNLLSVPLFGYRAWVLYCYVYAAYLFVGPLVFLVARPRSLWVSKNLRIAGYLGRLARWCFQPPKQRIAKAWQPKYVEKQAMMFLMVKIIYGPLMINSALIGYKAIPQFVDQIRAEQSLLNYFNGGYLLFVSLVFLVDSMLFCVGYHSESGLLKNKLRFVETNPLHILVCVACYPPFNRATISFFGASNQDPFILFAGDVMHPLTWVLRALAVFFLIVLITSSLSLFTKASNLTNRGIVDWGAYRIVRHPGYLAKNMFWLMTLLPVFIPNTSDPRFTWSGFLLFCATTIFGFIGWGTLYFFRAITEEKFLMRDPDYVAYCQKVKYRFIPGVY